jgi:hypothetical protein
MSTLADTFGVPLDDIRGISNVYDWGLMDITGHCFRGCSSCNRIIREYVDLVYAYRNGAPASETIEKLRNPKFGGVINWYDDYLEKETYDIRGCKRCLNEVLLAFGSDLDLEDSDRDLDYCREVKNQRLHYPHHGSRKNGKKPISRNKKYRDVCVV